MSEPHRHTDANDHPLGFPYWHFFDLGSDALRSAMRPVNRLLERAATADTAALGRAAARLLPVTTHLMRVLPVVGLAGETVHVYTPFMRAREDWQQGRLSNEKFGMLCAIYSAYAITGLGGVLTAGAKEGITYLVQRNALLEERYIPHTLFRELQHAGLVPGSEAAHHHHHEPDAPCELCASALSTLSAPATPRTPARPHQHQH